MIESLESFYFYGLEPIRVQALQVQSAEPLSMGVEPIPATRMVPYSLPVNATTLPSEYLS